MTLAANNAGLSRTLAQFVANTRFEDLSPLTVAMTKRCLLDAIGVSLAASSLGEGIKAFVELGREQGGNPQSTIIGFGEKAPSLLAAFANGAMAHALDFEDAHDRALVHPNAPTVPAALAVGEALGSIDGKRLITALAVGCEIVCRMGFSLRVSLDDYGWYPPPILGAFGATAATAHLYGLTPEQTIDAFSLALCQATCSAEIKYSPQSVIRAVRDSFAAKTGVLSTQLASKGVRGFDLPFEGKAGFFALFARGQYVSEDLTDGLGQEFAIDTISFKPWPTCRGTHVYIEGALATMREHNLTPDSIARIRTYGHRINRMLAEPVEQKLRPSTAIDAKFSIPFSVATALHRGSVTLDDFTSAGLRNEQVLATARKITFEVVGTEAHSIDDVTRGSMQIDMHDGRQFRRDMPHPYGHPDHPLSDAVLTEKFMACGRHAASRPDDAALRNIVDTTLSLEQVADVRQLMALL